MTTIRYTNADLVGSDEMIIGHGCNAQGVMGSGIALTIKQTHPGAFKAYRDRYERDGLKVGDVVVWSSPKRVVLNMVTQEFYGRDKTAVYVDYDGIRQVMRFVETTAQRHMSEQIGAFHTSPRLALPKIGAGRANGNWDRVVGIVEEEIRSIEVLVYVWP